MKTTLTLGIFLFLQTILYAQVKTSALDFSSYKPYEQDFLYGVNLGYYGDTWDDKDLADIAAGNPLKNIPGAGIKSLRPPLPGYFVEFYGKDVRLLEFQHYASLGMKDHTIMLGWPSDAQRETYDYGCGEMSKMFKDMYLPIWDDGENGTPYNDNNPYAKYVYELVSTYKDYTKFWEVMNEPDFDIKSQAWLGPDQPDNWWTNNPSPCALLNMKAPIFSYIRMLRISYEVIKTVDPEAYVCVGGIGYPSFLDAVLRNTDNPDNGTVTDDYPNKGGAYFDVLSFHSYPMYKLGVWSNAANGFVYKRHSDESVNVYLRDKNELEEVLLKHGFDGTTYPAKTWICTESNISRIPSENYIGSEVAQLNYTMKVQIMSQKNNIKQHYLFVLGEPKPESESSDPFDFMGLYKALEGKGPKGSNSNIQYTKAGIGLRTLSKELMGYHYDAVLTELLQLNEHIEGAAFRNKKGAVKYALWAKTTTDQSEDASYTYQLPETLDATQSFIGVNWEGNETLLNNAAIQLNGTPLILKNPSELLNLEPKNSDKEKARLVGYKLYPNPASSQVLLEYSLQQNERVTIQVINSSGSVVAVALQQVNKPSGSHQQVIDISSLNDGVYFIKFVTDKKYGIIPFVKQH